MTTYKKYRSDDPHSYAFGFFPTLEALMHAPQWCMAVVYHHRASKSDALHKVADLCTAHGIPFLADDKTVERLAPSENTYILTVFKKPQHALRADAPHVVLVSPSDMGNLGTIFRTALAFGVADVALIQPCADCYDPRAVRASMGAIFHLRVAQYATFHAYQEQFAGHPLFLLMTDGAIPLAHAIFTPPYALVFGNESAGLPPQFAEYGQTVGIPHSTAVDSLNLAVAVGIVLYHAVGTAS